MTTVRWTQPPPPEVGAAVGRLLDLVVVFLPAWCRVLYVSWCDSGEGSLADMSAGEEYRWATLTVYPPFLSLPLPDRLTTLAHELAHVYFNRLDSCVEDILAAVADPGAAKQLAEAVYERAAEAVTEDMGGALLLALQDLATGADYE